MKVRYWIGICLGALLCSCGEAEKNQEAVIGTNEYFDVQGLLTENEEALRQMDVKLEKEAVFAGEVERSSFRLDSAALAEELDAFREVDINKPVLSGRYQVREEMVDGQQLITYKADDEESLNINFLKIYRDEQSGAIARLEALFSNRNILYNSTRLLKLQYEEVNGRPLPRSYTVDGVQKMIFSDQEEYTIKAEFIY